MADIHLPDDIIRNILVRLPAKPLLRSRCVSTHWNHLISDPSFMNLRSSRKILFFARSLYVLNDKAPVDHQLMAELPYPFENHGRDIMVGTFNGIVFFVVCDFVFGRGKNTRHILLYNPFTRASKIVPDPYSPLENHAYGFAYGATVDDLKIFRFREFKYSNNSLDNRWTCDVLRLKTCSWSSSEIVIEDPSFKDFVGTFLDGFLYWTTCNDIVALNVKEMVISKIRLPGPNSYCNGRLGTLFGRLCIMSNATYTRCYVWIMNEENSWSKECSFTLGLEVSIFPCIRIMNIMDDGRILLKDRLNHVIVYDTLKHSSKTLNHLSPIRINYDRARGIAYMESLISPSDICNV